MEAETPKRKTGRALKWAFGLSLALNLVFVGLFAGALLRYAGDDRGGKRGAPGIQSYGAPFVRALPRDARRRLQEALRATDVGLPTRAERREAYQKIADLLRAQPFDPGAMKEVIVLQQGVAQGVQARAQTAWLDIVKDMSAAERNGVADRLQESLVRKRHKNKDRP